MGAQDHGCHFLRGRQTEHAVPPISDFVQGAAGGGGGGHKHGSSEFRRKLKWKLSLEHNIYNLHYFKFNLQTL